MVRRRGRGWHEGVIGIVASRLVERFPPSGRPDHRHGETWKGSGRSIWRSTFAARSARAEHLERYGGHRAAAGLSIRRDKIDAFAEAFAAHADAVLEGADLRPITADGRDPPARSAPDARPLLRARPARAVRPRQPGGDAAGRELRARRAGHRRRGPAPALPGPHAAATPAARSHSGAQRTARPVPRRRAYDYAFRLEANHWNGTVAPQLVVERIFDTPERYEELRSWLRGSSIERRPGPRERPEIFAELGLESGLRRSLLDSERFRTLLNARPSSLAALVPGGTKAGTTRPRTRTGHRHARVQAT